MPTLAALSLDCGVTTVTMTPNRVQGNTVYFDDGTDPLAGQMTMSTSLSVAKKAGEFSVASGILRIPYLDSVTGKVLFYDQIRLETRYGYGSTLANRELLTGGVFVGFAALTSVKDFFTKPQGWL